MERQETGPGLGPRLGAGDPDAGPALIEAHREAIVRFAFRYLGDAAAAEDAAQEVFVKALGARNAPESVRPWLYRIARNHCLNVLRRRRVRAEVAMPSEAPFARSGAGHLTRLVASEDAEEVRRRVQELSEEHREVLELRYGEGLGRGEIAEVLDLAPSTVKSRLYEAVRRLQ